MRTSTRPARTRRSGGATSRSLPTPRPTRWCRSSSRGWTSARPRAGSGSGRRSRTRASSTRSPRSASLPFATPTGWRSISPETSASPPGRTAISVRTATEDDHRLVYDTVIEVWQDTNDTYDETFEEWAHWLSRAPSTIPRSGSSPSRTDELAGFSICRQAPSTPMPAMSPCSASADPGGVRVSAKRCSCSPSRSSAGAGLTRGTLGVDASSATGATRLYQRAG